MVPPADNASYVIAVDAGGTHTRVACYGLDGSLRSRAVGKGGSPLHNHSSRDNILDTVHEALDDARLGAEHAIGLVAGLAHIGVPGSSAKNDDWAHDHFQIPGLGCTPLILNDAIIAHRGALLGNAGIMVVAGTGSMILAIDADGVTVESGRFEHYAGGARHVVREAMQLVLLGDHGPEDEEFLAASLEYWGAADLPSLRERLLGLAEEDRRQVRRRYGDFAHAVTAAAATSPLAHRALGTLAGKTARGVRLLLPLIAARPVPVALTGALATTPAFRAALSDALRGVPATIVPSILDPLGGAALIAYQEAGLDVGRAVIERLSGSMQSAGSD